MPIIVAELDKKSGAKISCELDMTHGYWQLLLHEDSQQCQSFVTSDGMFRPTSVLNGNLNRNANIHAAFMSKMPPDLKKDLVLLVGNLAIAVKDSEDLLKCITKLLDFCVEVHMEIHPANCRLFTNSVTWCGQRISAEIVRFNPRHTSGLEQMAMASIARELLQLTSVCSGFVQASQIFPLS